MDRIQLKYNQKGVSIVEALVAAVIIGIGFVAVYNLSSTANRILMSSIDREKGNMLVTTIFEDLLTDTSNLIAYHNMDFKTSGSGTGKHIDKKTKWAGLANKRFGSAQTKDERKLQVLKKTIDGKEVFIITVNIKSRNGIAKNQFKRIINAP